jgi:hypothetical protein
LVVGQKLLRFSGGLEELLAEDGNFRKHVQTKCKIFKSLHQTIWVGREDWQLTVVEAKPNSESF